MATFLSAEWRFLVMLNYEIDPALVRPYVPAGTELDFWNNRTFVSMVGFLFLDTKVFDVLPVPFHRNFEEVNLRMYVRRREGREWKRGVVFIKEIVPRLAIATLARALYNEKYVALPMRHAIDKAGLSLRPDANVRYEWKHGGRWNSLAATIQGEPALPAAGSQEEFITEHYWGYTAQRDGGTIEYRVEHPQWRAWQVKSATLDCDTASLYGPEFAGVLSRKPSTAFVAEGSRSVVSGGLRLPDAIRT